MRPSEALAKHLDEVSAILARYPIRNPQLFGSTARGEDTEESDLDIPLEHNGSLSTFDLAKLEIELESLLETRVDVRTPGDLSGRIAAGVEHDCRPL